MPKVDIVVLTWNQMNVIQSFVESFIRHTTAPCRLIIIDQGSADGSPEYLRSLKSTKFCSIEPVFNDHNKGFIGGMNQGMAMSNADYICLANNDLLFTDRWLEEILFVLEQNQKIGLLNPDSNNLNCHARSGQSIDDLAVELRQRHGEFAELPFCIGFCMFIRKEAMSKAGLLSSYLDSMFFDDTDYSMKVLKTGYLIGVARGAYVWHKEHASFKQMGDRPEELMQKNKVIFEKKWGKILRVCWVVTSMQELSEVLKKCLLLAREGNFVWIFTTFQTPDRKELFKFNGMTEHVGINIVNNDSLVSVISKILIKKKRFHIVINNNYFGNLTMQILNIKTTPVWDQVLYNKTKFL